MTTKTETDRATAVPAPTRRSHVPADGTAGRGRGRARPQGHAPRGARPQADPHRRGRPVRGAAAPGRRRLLQLPGRRDPAAVRRPRRLPRAAPRPRPPRAGRRPRRRRLRPRRPAGSASAWAPPARARRTSSPGSAPRCSTRSRWSRSPATCRRRLIGKDAFQEIDINGITLPMTKHNYLVRDADELPRVIAEAFHIARTGRPGPVHVDITKDALQQETTRPASRPRRSHRRAARLPPEPRRPPAQLKLAAQEIAAAQAAGHPGRPRRPPRRGLGRPRGLRREDADPGRPDAARHRRHRRDASADLRLHGHARLEARQPGDPVGRPAHRARDALRRPGHRQRPHLRAVRADHPRRHRPGRDRQERGRRGAHRRRRRARAAGADPDGRGGRSRDARGLLRPAGRVAARLRGVARGTARARGATACCRPTTSSSGSAS